jgi:hypothetical protein
MSFETNGVIIGLRLMQEMSPFIILTTLLFYKKLIINK